MTRAAATAAAAALVALLAAPVSARADTTAPAAATKKDATATTKDVTAPTAATTKDATAPASAIKIDWRTDVAGAEREAARSRRPLLIFFSADWCMPCKEMLATSFADAAVVDLVARRFVPLFVDVTDEDAPATAAGKRFGVRAVPTLLVLRGSAERLRRERLLPPAELRAALAQIR